MPAGKVHVHHPCIFTEALEQIFSDCNKLLEKKITVKTKTLCGSDYIYF